MRAAAQALRAAHAASKPRGSGGRLLIVGCLGVVLALGGVAATVLLLGVDGTAMIGGGDVSVRLCGSNTVGAELAPALAQAYLLQRGASDLRRESDGSSVRVSAMLPNNPNRFVIEVRSEGTGTAFGGLGSGECDVAMASRRVLDSESSSLGAGLGENVIALDGIAVFVNPAVTLSALDLTQLAGIFSVGPPDAATWNAFGGAPQVVAHDEKSGTFDTFRSLVLGSRSVSGSAQRLSASADIVRAVAAASIRGVSGR